MEEIGIEFGFVCLTVEGKYYPEEADTNSPETFEIKTITVSDSKINIVSLFNWEQEKYIEELVLRVRNE